MNYEEIAKLQEFSKDLKVLYVEDNEEARLATIDILGEFFDNVTVAFNGEDGLNKFKEDSFDLIISDINMPKMNGIDMVSKIREINNDVPILIISAYSESGYFMETIRLGVEGYLLKPIELEQFINMITKTIEKVKLRMIQKEYQNFLEKENLSLNNDLVAKDKQIKEQIYIDNVTGLNNRFALERDIENNEKPYSGIILIDINNFRKFNELYGFESGNELLVSVSDIIDTYCFENKLKGYRVSADEFVIFKEFEKYNLQLVDESVKDILGVLDNKKFKMGQNDDEILLNVTLGVSLDSEDVLTKATSALDIAKLNNEKFMFFDENEDFHGELKNLFFWQNNINVALENDNIVPYFQPIFDANKNIVKYEVLMRMIQEEDGETNVITPFRFLDISLKTKQYDQLSYTIVSKALTFARQNEDKVFSINLGYRDMTNNKIKELIQAYVKQSVASNKECNLIFEFVESEDIKDYKDVSDFFDNFKCSHIQIAIDDFGSGYSNFTNLLEINPQYIKIDGSLIKDINTNEKHLILTKAIISFARQLNIKTIAEFVHSDEIFQILIKEGVDEFQGFYLQEPRGTI